MTKQEIQQKLILKLVEIINNCNEDFHAAYEKRNKLLAELNKWVIETLKEATDGN